MKVDTASRVGVWLVGARGSLATTTIVGATAISEGLTEPDGCVTELPDLRGADVVPIDALAFGGCDIVDTPIRKRAEQLVQGGVLPARLIDPIGTHLDRVERSIIQLPAGGAVPQQRQAESLVAELAAFQERVGADRIVVINVSSTEAQPQWDACLDDLDRLEAAMRVRSDVLPPSSLYAYAAFRGGHAFVDFTPSFGTRPPALAQLALQEGLPYAGRDGKTGETLVKTALAPMFAHRGLHVRSWYGANILGGGDGCTLDEGDACTSKIESKQRSLSDLLGYTTQGRVHIDYVAEMGDWKTAWNHISFQGFLGVQMKMQFTWQGCDSALAAPLVLDLARLTALADQRGRSGPLGELAFFFKDPIGDHSDGRLVMQYEALRNWATAAEVTA